MPASEFVGDRLYRNTVKDGDCVIWLGAKSNRSEHGLIKYEGKMQSTHRVAYFLAYGYMPDENVLHTCDRAACVNPKHLYAGTQLENMHDMIERNPGLPSMKLTQVQVDEIRELGGRYSQRSLAKRYGVNHSTISRILNYKRRLVVSAK